MRFSDAVKLKARWRQWDRCGVCGDPLYFSDEHAHHLKPKAAGGLNAVENCVMVCSMCHERVHNDGNYRSLIVAPKKYFRYFNGPR